MRQVSQPNNKHLLFAVSWNVDFQQGILIGSQHRYLFNVLQAVLIFNGLKWTIRVIWSQIEHDCFKVRRSKFNGQWADCNSNDVKAACNTCSILWRPLKGYLGRWSLNKRNEKSPDGPQTCSEFSSGRSHHALYSHYLEHYFYNEK